MPAALDKLITPPALPVKPSQLSAEDKAAVAEVAAHFNKEDYTAPDGENKTTRSPLILREYMFFVSLGRTRRGDLRPAPWHCRPRQCLDSRHSSVNYGPRS